MGKRRLIVGLSGASGVIYGIQILKRLRELPDVETHLVYTRAALRTLQLETGESLQVLRELADVTYKPEDIAASISSGSFVTVGMIIAPCSINTMGAISSSSTNNLITRAADVVLKERRRLVLMVRESPLHAGHLRQMRELALMGAVICPPVPAFYHQPTSIEDLVDHTIGRALDLFGIHLSDIDRWKSP